jgi:hypothetical protein
MTQIAMDTLADKSGAKEAGAGYRSVVLTTDVWKPAYAKGDTLFLDKHAKLTNADHVLVVTMDERVYLGAITKNATNELSMVCFNEFQDRITIPRNEITIFAKVAGTIKA